MSIESSRIENHRIQVTDLSCGFNDGQAPIFSHLNFTLHTGITAIVGNNGSGKSLLAALLAGKKKPQGSIHVTGTVGYLAQTLNNEDGLVSDILGYTHLAAAYARIEQGECLEADFTCLEGHWDFASKTSELLHSFGLNQAMLSRNMQTLSGGEQTKIRLMQLALKAYDIMILDEPSNHLDRASREQLIAWIKQQPCVVIVTHNRQILHIADEIIELEQGKALHIKAGWAVYLQTKAEQRTALARQEKKYEQALKHSKKTHTEQTERQAQRLKQGRHNRKGANQSTSLLDAAKETAETSHSGKLKTAQRNIAHYQQQLHEVQEQKARTDPLHFPMSVATKKTGVILQLNDLYLPYVSVGPLNLQLHNGDKIAILGPNGCGKSTLLKVIAGHLSARSGQFSAPANTLYLDQHFSLLDPNKTALENFAALCPDYTQTEYRIRLAHIRLRKDKALYPVAHLSGGERLKLVLACLLASKTPIDLLLLDEPDNHLDLASKALLEQVLRDYLGALLVVSHDADFIHNGGIVEHWDLSNHQTD